MNSTRTHSMEGLGSRRQLAVFYQGIPARAATWMIAVVCTLFSITFQVLWMCVGTVARISVRFLVYAVLSTLLFCIGCLLVILSIISLGTISLP